MEKKYLWCSVHTPTKEQLISLEKMGELVYLKDVNPILQERINNCSSDATELLEVAISLGTYQTKHDYTLVQIGGSPMFLFMCGSSVKRSEVMFSHSVRDSIDVTQEDGTVIKTSVFKHVKWIKSIF